MREITIFMQEKYFAQKNPNVFEKLPEDSLFSKKSSTPLGFFSIFFLNKQRGSPWPQVPLFWKNPTIKACSVIGALQPGRDPKSECRRPHVCGKRNGEFSPLVLRIKFTQPAQPEVPPAFEHLFWFFSRLSSYSLHNFCPASILFFWPKLVHYAYIFGPAGKLLRCILQWFPLFFTKEYDENSTISTHSLPFHSFHWFITSTDSTNPP